MLNNDILRQMRYLLDISDKKFTEIFILGGAEIEKDEVCAFLKKDDDAEYKPCNDRLMISFLDGLISLKRGKKDVAESGLEKQKKLTNNEIFKKLRIAFELKDDDIIEILHTQDVLMSKSELSAFFRKVGHENFKECKDQFLRKFLRGLTGKFRSIS